jgi:hypothetical protein
MTTYMLMLNHAPDRYDGLSEDAYMTIIKDYVDWVEEMTKKGVYKGGHKLAGGPGKTLTTVNGTVEVHESPFAELPEVLGGVMLFEAEDEDAAIAIAKGHPHFKHNHSLELRAIHEV